MTEEATDFCLCGCQRDRHPGGKWCMGARMMSACAHRCASFRLDGAATKAWRAEQAHYRAQHARIDRAAPFIDADGDVRGWKPSSLIRIGYSVLATSRHPDSADAWLDELLDEARNRFRSGLPCNPFNMDQPA